MDRHGTAGDGCGVQEGLEGPEGRPIPPPSDRVPAYPTEQQPSAGDGELAGKVNIGTDRVVTAGIATYRAMEMTDKTGYRSGSSTIRNQLSETPRPTRILPGSRSRGDDACPLPAGLLAILHFMLPVAGPLPLPPLPPVIQL